MHKIQMTEKNVCHKRTFAIFKVPNMPAKVKLLTIFQMHQLYYSWDNPVGNIEVFDHNYYDNTACNIYIPYTPFNLFRDREFYC